MDANKKKIFQNSTGANTMFHQNPLSGFRGKKHGLRRDR